MSVKRIFRPVPKQVRDDLAQLIYGRVISLMPLLDLGVCVTAIGAGLVANASVPRLLAIGVPALIIIFTLMRSFVWFRRRQKTVSAELAAKRLNGMTVVVFITTSLFAIWGVWTWYTAAHVDRISVPIFLTLAALVSSSCMSGLRVASLATIAICIGPMMFALLTSGESNHFMIGIYLVVLTAVQARLVFQQHSQIVDMLVLQRKMRRLANTDMLTNLPNRRAFFLEVDEHLSDTENCIVALLDLDGFKPVNDALGHLAGDKLLVQIADRLRKQMDPNMLVARLGGDEFAILFRDLGDMNVASAKAVAILASLALPCNIDGHHVSVTASIGLSRFPPDGATATELLSAADAALYAAKAEGRAQFKVADESVFHAKAA